MNILKIKNNKLEKLKISKENPWNSGQSGVRTKLVSLISWPVWKCKQYKKFDVEK